MVTMVTDSARTMGGALDYNMDLFTLVDQQQRTVQICQRDAADPVVTRR